MTDFNDKQIEIILVAEKLFAEKGFDGTSIRDIAKTAGINIAMISYYFGSKEKLLESVVIFRISNLKLQLESIYEELLSPIEKIEKIIALYILRLYRNRNIYQILNFETASNKRNINFSAFTEVKKQNYLSFQKIIEEGQEKGIFKKNINIPLIMPIVIGSLTHFNNSRLFFEDILGLKTENEFDNYIENEFTKHIQQTIKALLVYEN
ncbi:TetR family transcriptional regulator [Flavobacterium psychrophilum]|jgi:AcrR family transcriptional regulator|uniref:TetR/AcrR family transcriptional regulator n=1 Tax=Flavobacterium psychrophilum TaxID=96345 RepID=UPI000B7C4254|nr:TetR family transcriptional regulator [Flavobacterium psychrophilum]EKT3966120.1 TetR/AcrR family transcriptional regulator [Flavobacterium psychrophilum]EKT4548840.1 TetR/AcrR family transcriptional regulator [Flavobacterium psychrophilum]EKT4552087.1 TetR/AcrR family transcriptional regulator [Flavobacterium psychrophilum]ELI6455350.1 TetR/AcrR family transcriptional regulator [Flavobacterium psychrophilum]ELM3642808.1 TetR/AcrR family transcriptional regulator [Flavobacterium psychrophil